MKDIETYKILNEESIKKYLLVLKKNNELMKYVNSLKSRINELATIKYDYEELFEYYKKALKQNEDNTKQNKYWRFYNVKSNKLITSMWANKYPNDIEDGIYYFATFGTKEQYKSFIRKK